MPLLASVGKVEGKKLPDFCSFGYTTNSSMCQTTNVLIFFEAGYSGYVAFEGILNNKYFLQFHLLINFWLYVFRIESGFDE